MSNSGNTEKVQWFSKIWITLIVAGISFSYSQGQTNPVYNVNTTDDGHDYDVSDGICATADDNNTCTLRAAIEQNNALPGPGGHWGLIYVPAGKYVLEHGELEVTTTTSIIGEGPLTTRIDASKDRAFHIHGPQVSHFSGFTIYNAQSNEGNSGGEAGGGSAIHISTPETHLNMVRVHAVKCSTDWVGGGMFNDGGSVTIIESRFENCQAPRHDGSGVEGRGGAIYSSGNIKIYRSEFTNNHGTSGGAIYNVGKMEITNSTFSGNIVTYKGGAILNAGSGPDGHLWLSHNTITQNETGADLGPEATNQFKPWGELQGGGGVYNTGTLMGANNIIVKNIDLNNLSQHKPSPDCWSIEHEGTVWNEETQEYETGTISPTFSSRRNNIVKELNPATCNMADHIWGDYRFDHVGFIDNPLPEQLGTRTLYEGGLSAFPLLTGSLAIDNAGNSFSGSFFDCPKRDQRGVLRPEQDGQSGTESCDIGAFEQTPQTTFMEAEDAHVFGAYFQTAVDAAASGGEYVYVPSDLPNAVDEPDEQQRLEFDIYIETPGTYNIVGWARVFAPDHNSFWVRVDDQPEEAYLWDLQGNGASFLADPLSHRGTGNENNPDIDPIEVYFSRGVHTITVYLRENFTQLDRIQIVPATSDFQALEVESSAFITGDFMVVNDPAASNSQYVIHPASQPDITDGPDDAHKITQTLTVNEAGTYLIRAQVWAEFDSKNSFYVKVDGLPEDGYLWDMTENNFSFDPDYVSHRGNGTTGSPEQDPVEVYLTEGEHTIEVFAREAGTGIDNIGLELKQGGNGFVCEGDCLNAEPIVKDEIKVLNTTGDKWYVVSDNVNGWQASEMAGRSIFVNGVQVQPGEVPLPEKVNGKYYFHFSAGQHPWASWSFWNW